MKYILFISLNLGPALILSYFYLKTKTGYESFWEGALRDQGLFFNQRHEFEKETLELIIRNQILFISFVLNKASVLCYNSIHAWHLSVSGKRCLAIATA